MQFIKKQRNFNLIPFTIGGVNTIRRTVKCMNETISQLVDGVRTVQDDQSKMCIVIEKLATKVMLTKSILVVH